MLIIGISNEIDMSHIRKNPLMERVLKISLMAFNSLKKDTFISEA